MFRVAVLISGRGSNLGSLIQSKGSGKTPIEIAAVISDNKEALGLELAQESKIRTTVVERKKGEQTLQEFFTHLTTAVTDLKPDLIVLAGFMRIIPEEMIRRFEGRMINIHPSLLPAFKGLRAQKQALDAGVKFSGCSVHFVTQELDAGAVIAQAVVPVFAGDTEESLSSRILVEEHKLLPAVVQAIAEKRIEIKEGKVIIRGEVEGERALRSLETC